MNSKKVINKVKKAIKQHLDDGYTYDMLVCIEFDVIDWKSLLEYIDKLQQENKDLKSQLRGTTYCYDEEEHRRLVEENKQLKDNWNKLKKWLYEDHYLYVPEIAINSTYQVVLDKMLELQQGGNSNVKD